jgi:hypothetical protein
VNESADHRVLVFTGYRRSFERWALVALMFVCAAGIAAGISLVSRRGGFDDACFGFVWLGTVIAASAWPLCDARLRSLRWCANGLGVLLFFEVFVFVVGACAGHRWGFLPIPGFHLVSPPPAEEFMHVICVFTAPAGLYLAMLCGSLERTEARAAAAHELDS